MPTEKYDQDEILKQMASEAVRQQERIRTAVRDLTLRALEAREFGVSQIKNVIHQVTEGVNKGLSDKVNTEKLVSDAIAGMDDALLKVVEANKIALSKISEGGANFSDSTIAKTLAELETVEEQFRSGIRHGADAASANIKKQWAVVLDKIPQNQTETGEQVLETLALSGKQAEDVLKATRETGLKLAHTLTQNYATLVSGILMGLTEGMRGKKEN